MGSHVDQDTKTSSPQLRLAPLPQGGELARFGRSDVAGIPPRLPGIRPPARAATKRLTGSFGFGLSFIACVLLPTAFAAVYYGLIASNIYVSEAKFAVRGAVERLPGVGGSGLAGVMNSLVAVNNNQDAYIVSNYIKSTPLVEKLERENGLQALYGRNDIDFLARLKDGASVEDLRHYWDRTVTTYVDNISGILTLQVQAFSAQDALTLSNAVLGASEALVNEMSARRLADTLKYASDEVTRAEQRLQAARLAIQEFRNRSGLVDPVKQTESTLMLLTQLRSERIQLENELATARRTLTDKAPSVQVLGARLKAMTDQIQGMEKLVTSQSAADRPASRALFQYEGLELERQFAEKLYLISQAALERARMNAERQQLYLVTFVKPALAEDALYPRRVANVILVFVLAGAIWSILSLIVAGVKDHFI